MSDSEDLPKLRMVRRDSPEELARRFEREQRVVLNDKEARLEKALGSYRVGSVPYLNAVPLTRGLEEEIQFCPPSQLARMLRANELDAALVSVTEVLFHDLYDVLDGIAVASLGEVKSVLLAHRGPIEDMREVYCDTASLTSVHLLRVLLAERGLHPEFKPLQSYDRSEMPENALLIGDPAIRFLQSSPDHSIWDLGTGWQELTGLPFVYAIWALRRGIDQKPLARHLREARDFGLDTLDYIVSEHREFDREFRKDYLGWHIHYHLGSDERRGLARFVELLRRHTEATVFEPRFVS